MNDLEKQIIERYGITPDGALPYRLPISRFGDFRKILRMADVKVGVEIGVDRGRMSKAMCDYIPGLKLYCVDAWKAYSDYSDIISQETMNENEAEARRRLAPYDCTIIKATSMEAVKKFSLESVDFVWIDANHTFDYAMEDLIYWERVVKPGGIVAGHDYSKFRKFFGVIEAVNAYTSYHKIDPWFILAKDKSPGFFWFKK